MDGIIGLNNSFVDFFLNPTGDFKLRSLLFWIVCGVVLCVFLYKMLSAIFTTKIMSIGEGIIILTINAVIVVVGINFFSFNIVIAVVTFFTTVAYFSYNIIMKKRGKDALQEQISLDITRCIEEIKKNPTNKYAYEKLGDIYREIKDYDKALVFYRRVLELSDENASKKLINSKILSTEKDKEYHGQSFKKIVLAAKEEEKKQQEKEEN